ncbi:MAG: cell division protein FtsZ [Alphaproteobacteria bacterium]|nr:cell division protein FtsZ [Alphaproteobacteria bacterium]
MNLKMSPKDKSKLAPEIIVAGIGGAGGNAVDHMIEGGLAGAKFLICNTDAQALTRNQAEYKIQLGVDVTGGLGAGANPDIGASAAEESVEEIAAYLEGANMVFITAGMGGGTGTGAAPVIARIARERGILTVGVVTKPFHFEGTKRMKMAEAGIAEMQKYVDTLIVIPNQNLFRVANEKTTFAEAFRMADSVLQSAVRGVTDLMVKEGNVNLDFNDVKAVMREMGKAVMGTGEAEGDNRAIEAAEAAINNPLLDDVSLKGARAVIINVTGGQDMTLFEADEACLRITKEVDPDANIIFGCRFDESLQGIMRVSVVAAGIDVTADTKRTTTTSTSGGQGFVTRTTPRSYMQQTQVVQQQAPAPVEVQPATPTRMVAVPRPLNIYDTTVPQPAIQQEETADAGDLFQAAAAKQKTDGTAADVKRGTRYGESFIPPEPVEADAAQKAATYNQEDAVQPTLARQPVQQQAPQYVQPQQPQRLMYAEPVQAPAYTAPQANYAQQPMAAPARQAAYAQPEQTAAKKPLSRKAMSFIERVTGSLFSRDEEDLSEVAPQARPQQQPPMNYAQTYGQEAQPVQERLNMDRPYKAPAAQGESELDIPAFLRRQAN